MIILSKARPDINGFSQKTPSDRLTRLKTRNYNKQNFTRRCESWTFTYVTEKKRFEGAMLALSTDFSLIDFIGK